MIILFPNSLLYNKSPEYYCNSFGNNTCIIENINDIDNSIIQYTTICIFMNLSNKNDIKNILTLLYNIDTSFIIKDFLGRICTFDTIDTINYSNIYKYDTTDIILL